MGVAPVGVAFVQATPVVARRWDDGRSEGRRQEGYPTRRTETALHS